MSLNITMDGIDEAISNLNYRSPNSPKHKLVYAIRKYYDAEGALGRIRRIDGDQLIRQVWETGENVEAVQSRRKNFNSVKSLINQELDALYRGEKNPEGITIGPDNTFEMSDEAKARLFSSFTRAVNTGEGVTLDKIAEVLNVVTDALSGNSGGYGADEVEKFKELVRRLPEKFDTLSAGESDEAPPRVTQEMDAASAGGLEEIDESSLDEVELAVPGDEGADAGGGTSETVEVVNVLEDDGTGLGEMVDAEAASGLAEIDADGLGEAELAGPGDEGEVDTAGDGYRAEEDGPDDRKVLKDRFDGYLGTTERFYNQYLLVPAGTYTTGGRNPKGDESPMDSVELNGFYMGKFPITNALFEVFVEKTGYKTTAEVRGYGVVYQGRFQKIADNRTGLSRSVWNATHTRKRVEGACWYQPSGPGSTLHNKRNHPVVQVSIADAAAFAAWTGKRLPTEAEWEAAARTDHGHIFPWGDEWDEKRCNTEAGAVSDTTPVDRYEAATNGFGLWDLLGNVLEWTGDSCDPLYSRTAPVKYYIAKGGSWVSDHTVRLSSRFRFEKEFSANILGFRCLAD